MGVQRPQVWLAALRGYSPTASVVQSTCQRYKQHKETSSSARMSSFSYTLRQLATILTAATKNTTEWPDWPIEHLLIDSRQLIAASSTLFFALPGQRTDGHQFVADLYRQGVRAFVVNKPVAGCEEAVFFVHEDVKAALQQIAVWHRHQCKLPVVGVTGSNGKTTVKEWLYQLLSPAMSVWCSPRSYNSQLGVPLSVWGIRPHHQLAIIEAGISKAGEMDVLADIIAPTYGIFTNLGTAHDQGFTDREAKLQEKSQLFRGVELLICCRDHEQLFSSLQAAGLPLLSWSITGRDADLSIERIAGQSRTTRLKTNFRGIHREISIPFADDIAVENACHCWALLLQLGIADETIAAGMASLVRPGLRLELKAGRQDCLIIDDTYSNDLTSLAAAITFAEQQAGGRPMTLILSDLLESGLKPAALYPQVAKLLENRFHRIMGVGEAIHMMDNFLPPAIERRFYPGTESLLNELEERIRPGELILLKGARKYAFERISYRLGKQTHRTVLEIDLTALGHNLAAYRNLVRPKVKIAAMVKAAAYGSGGPEVARVLEQGGVDYLVVAYPDEGVELRRAGISLPVMVLNAEAESFELLYEYQLEPEVYSWVQLQALAQMAAAPAIHIKMDTGMHRLGFDAADAPRLADFFAQHPRLLLASVFTHLAAAEAAEHDLFTRKQVAVFEQAAAAICEKLDYKPLWHVLNSNGIARFPDYQFDMVRLGIGLYGLEVAALQQQLRPVLCLKARVAQLRDIPAGDSVSYGRKGILLRDSRVATMSIGYADGLPRAAGLGRYALLLHGQQAPIVGAVCMDMCMVDVTDIPQVREGDAAIVFGEYPTVEQLATVADTIPYEILTGISGRVHRVYVQE